MSFTTRCPACGTMFRVVPDQLKIADGWVRCGHCADVFDATLYLDNWVTDDPSAAPEPTSEASLPRPPVEQPGLPQRGTALYEPEPEPEPDTPAVRPEAPEETCSRLAGEISDRSEPAPSSAPTADEAPPDFHVELARFAAARAGGADSTRTDASTSLPLVAPEPEPAVHMEVAPEPEPVPLVTGAGAADEPEPGFVRQARRRAFWRTPAVRAGMLSLALLLSLLLMGQWAVHERNSLAARHPGLESVLAQLCEPLGCALVPVRRIDAIVIDSTALVRRLGNFYAFDIALKNTAPMAVAMPALELSLTDTRDAVVARRVFLAEELPGAPSLLPAQGSVTLSLRLALDGALPMAGYRALVFYP